MKNLKFLVIPLLFVGTITKAQFVRNAYISIGDPIYFLSLPLANDHKKEYFVKHNIKTIEVSGKELKKNGKSSAHKNVNTYHIDSLGNVTQIDRVEKGKLKYITYYYYNSENKVVRMDRDDDKGSRIESKIQEYGDKAMPTNYYHISDGDTVYQMSRGVIKDLKSTDAYYQKGKLKYRWESTYYVDNQRKQTTLYKSNGKVKYIWDYQCKEEGQEINKHKDTTRVCKSKSTDSDGITTTVEESVNEKGDITKYVSKTNANNKILYWAAYHGGDEILNYENQYNYDESGNVLVGYVSKNYTKGDLRSIYNRQYDLDGNIVKSESKGYKNGKLIRDTKQTVNYDKENRIIQDESSNFTRNTSTIHTYEYTSR